MELTDALDAVHGSQAFLNFVRSLIADREDEVRKEQLQPSPRFGPGANGWENGTIEAFLSAAAAWAESSDFGLRQSLSEPTNPWHQFALFLYLGKIYE